MGHVVDSIGSLFGLGLSEGGGIGSDVGSVVDSIGSLLGFGLKHKKEKQLLCALLQHTHNRGKLHGGAWYDDFLTGFKMPFQDVASIL